MITWNTFSCSVERWSAVTGGHFYLSLKRLITLAARRWFYKVNWLNVNWWYTGLSESSSTFLCQSIAQDFLRKVTIGFFFKNSFASYSWNKIVFWHFLPSDHRLFFFFLFAYFVNNGQQWAIDTEPALGNLAPRAKQ